MKKISQQERDAVIKELQQGLKPKDIQSKYGISKQSMYTIKKQGQPVSNNNVVKEPELTAEEIQEAQYDPVNIKDFVNEESHQEETKTHAKIPKSLINLANKKLKEDNKTNEKSKNNNVVKTADVEPTEDQLEEEKQQLICKIRQYVFAFESNRYINEYVGNDKDKYLIALEKKTIKDLNTIIKYIQFHIRNNKSNSTVIESTLVTLMVVIEKIGSKVGLQFDGLAKDISLDLKNDESDLKRAVTELNIESNISSYFNSPKVDILMQISQKLLFTHQKNKQLQLLNVEENKTVPVKPVNQSAEAYLKSTMNNELKEKYQDI